MSPSLTPGPKGVINARVKFLSRDIPLSLRAVGPLGIKGCGLQPHKGMGNISLTTFWPSLTPGPWRGNQRPS